MYQYDKMQRFLKKRDPNWHSSVWGVGSLQADQYIDRHIIPVLTTFARNVKDVEKAVDDMVDEHYDNVPGITDTFVRRQFKTYVYLLQDSIKEHGDIYGLISDDRMRYEACIQAIGHVFCEYHKDWKRDHHEFVTKKN